MKKFVTLLVVLITLVSTATSAQPTPSLPNPVHIDVPNRMQQTHVWCWAAVSQQIIEWSNGTSPPQCALVAAANYIVPPQCCGNANPSCVRTGSMEQIQSLIATFAYHPSHVIQPSFDPLGLYVHLKRGQPVILQVRTNPMQTHVMVLVGMSFMRTNYGPPIAMLNVNDPMLYNSQPIPWPQIYPTIINALVID